jgi:hypothetical protein
MAVSDYVAEYQKVSNVFAHFPGAIRRMARVCIRINDLANAAGFDF